MQPFEIFALSFLLPEPLSRIGRRHGRKFTWNTQPLRDHDQCFIEWFCVSVRRSNHGRNWRERSRKSLHGPKRVRRFGNSIEERELVTHKVKGEQVHMNLSDVVRPGVLGQQSVGKARIFEKMRGG